MDKMTTDERQEKFYAGEKIDRVPFMTFGTTYSGRAYGLNSEEYYLDVEKNYKSQLWTYEMFQSDEAPSYNFPEGAILNLGGEVRLSGQRQMTLPIAKRPIKTEEDAWNYILPDMDTWIYLDKQIEFFKYTKSQGLSTAGVYAGTPFTIVGYMVEIETLLKWMHKKPKLVHNLLRIATDYLLMSADAIIDEMGEDALVGAIDLCFETNDFMSGELFEEFSLPYIVDIFEKLRQRGVEDYSVHLCGNHMENIKYLDCLNLKPLTFISSDELNPLDKVADIMGEDKIYAGNVSSSLLVEGTPDQVYRESERIIKMMKNRAAGFALVPSCDYPINGKAVNLYAMLKACRDFGTY